MGAAGQYAGCRGLLAWPLRAPHRRVHGQQAVLGGAGAALGWVAQVVLGRAAERGGAAKRQEDTEGGGSSGKGRGPGATIGHCAAKCGGPGRNKAAGVRGVRSARPQKRAKCRAGRLACGRASAGRIGSIETSCGKWVLGKVPEWLATVGFGGGGGGTACPAGTPLCRAPAPTSGWDIPCTAHPGQARSARELCLPEWSEMPQRAGPPNEHAHAHAPCSLAQTETWQLHRREHTTVGAGMRARASIRLSSRTALGAGMSDRGPGLARASGRGGGSCAPVSPVRMTPLQRPVSTLPSPLRT